MPTTQRDKKFVVKKKSCLAGETKPIESENPSKKTRKPRIVVPNNNNRLSLFAAIQYRTTTSADQKTGNQSLDRTWAQKTRRNVIPCAISQLEIKRFRCQTRSPLPRHTIA